MSNSNNPPFAILELDKETAEFLLDNCDSNITFGLNAMQNADMGRESLERLVALMEKFKLIRQMLKKQGVE